MSEGSKNPGIHNFLKMTKIRRIILNFKKKIISSQKVLFQKKE